MNFYKSKKFIRHNGLSLQSNPKEKEKSYMRYPKCIRAMGGEFGGGG